MYVSRDNLWFSYGMFDVHVLLGLFPKSGTKNQLVITSKIWKRRSKSSQSTCPVGQVLWEEFLKEVILHITCLCSLLHTLLKDTCTCLQDE